MNSIEQPTQGPMREGDIFFWRWNDKTLDARLKSCSGSYQLAYWCKSQIAIVRNGRLIDTYWSDNSSDRAIDPSQAVLDYKGNESELRKINHWEKDYYEPDDVVDMRHANSWGDLVYVKPDAKRSQAHILQHLTHLREQEEAKIRAAQWSIESLDAQIAEASAGILDKVTR